MVATPAKSPAPGRVKDALVDASLVCEHPGGEAVETFELNPAELLSVVTVGISMYGFYRQDVTMACVAVFLGVEGALQGQRYVLLFLCLSCSCH